MASAIVNTQDNNESLAQPQFEEPKNRCMPSERIIRFFLDDLSPGEKKNLTNHFSGCDLCSARLLALEISAQMIMTSAQGTARSTTVVLNATAPSNRDLDHKPASSTRRRRRIERATPIAIDPLEDRDLLTGMMGAVDLQALNRGAEIELLKVAIARLPNESRGYHTRATAGGAVLDPRHWDLAIHELAGNTLFPHVVTTASRMLAAA
jgi:hypothetical protein